MPMRMPSVRERGHGSLHLRPVHHGDRPFGPLALDPFRPLRAAVMILTDLLNAASAHPAITVLAAMFLAATFSDRIINDLGPAS